MFKRTYLLLFVFIFMVFTGIACSNQDPETDVENNAEQETEEDESHTNDDADDEESTRSDVNDEQNNDEVANSESMDDNDETTTSDSTQSTGSKDLPKPIEINDRIQTDTGLIFELEKITFEDDHIAVDFNADNLSGFDKTLASKGVAQNTNLGGITLQDDTGFDYRYVAEHDDARIVLEDQEEVDATVRFLGRIQDDAKTLTLIFNPDYDSDSAPTFTYENIEIEW